MRFELNIDYSPDSMAASRARMEARAQRRYVDRVPVNYCIVPRFFAPVFGVPYLDLFRDAETQYHWLLQFAKYQIENIPSDVCTGTTLYVHPYFDNAVPPSAQGAEIGWAEGSPPRALPTIHNLEQMEAFQVAAPNSGLRGTVIDWWQQMQAMAAKTRLTFGSVEGHVEVACLGTGGLSAHMLAVDLVGEPFYWWMLEYPEACHRFLAKITEGELEAERLVRRIDPRPRGSYGLAEDSAQIMSPALFRSFCLPYTERMFAEFGAGLANGRAIHMCGESRHLHAVLRDELRMSAFDIFGYMVPPREAAANLGSSCLLWGNLNPMLMKDGRPAEVYATARECLEAMAPCGGFMLGDGANVCPDTPLASFSAIMRAAEDYGVPLQQ
jgi:uroporphyrinogen-III decarboxylase